MASRVESGTGFAAVHAHLVVLAGDDSEELRSAVWSAVRCEGFDSVLDALTLDGAFRPSSFVVAHEEPDGLRLVLRGDAVVAVSTGDGDEHFDAIGVRTWSERFVADWHGFVATVEAPDRPIAPLSILESGMTGASSCARTRSGVAMSARDSGVRNADAGEDALPSPVLAEVSSDEIIVPAAHELDPPVAAVSESAGESAGADTQWDVDPSAGAEPDDAAPVDATMLTPIGELLDDEVTEPEVGSSYSEIFGATQHRSVTGAAIADPEAPPVSIIEVPKPTPVEATSPDHPDRAESTWSSRNFDPNVPAGDESSHEGDHDGNTLSIAEVRRLRGTDVDSFTAAPSGVGTATVQALTCGRGHLNPPYDAVCRVCQLALEGTPSVVDRPPLGRLRFSTGDDVILDRSLLVGRKPDPKGRRFSDIPRLLQLDVGDGLSRSHALVSLDGWQVRVEDLGSTNDTTVTLPGRQPQRLRSGEPVLIVDGTTIDLGGEVECVFDAQL